MTEKTLLAAIFRINVSWAILRDRSILFTIFQLCPLCFFVAIIPSIATKMHKGHKIEQT
jgi:hypothetical protein